MGTCTVSDKVAATVTVTNIDTGTGTVASIGTCLAKEKAEGKGE